MSDLAESGARSGEAFDDTTRLEVEPPRLVQPPPLPPPIARPNSEGTEDRWNSFDDASWASLIPWASTVFVLGVAMLVTLCLVSPTKEPPAIGPSSLAAVQASHGAQLEEIEWVAGDRDDEADAAATLVAFDTETLPVDEFESIDVSVVASALSVDALLAEVEEPESSSTSDAAVDPNARSAKVPPASAVAVEPFMEAAPDCAGGKCRVLAEDPGCDAAAGRRFGTLIEWAESPNEAARLAKRDGKLLMLLQVSGNFAREEFT